MIRNQRPEGFSMRQAYGNPTFGTLQASGLAHSFSALLTEARRALVN